MSGMRVTFQLRSHALSAQIYASHQRQGLQRSQMRFTTRGSQLGVGLQIIQSKLIELLVGFFRVCLRSTMLQLDIIWGKTRKMSAPIKES